MDLDLLGDVEADEDEGFRLRKGDLRIVVGQFGRLGTAPIMSAS